MGDIWLTTVLFTVLYFFVELKQKKKEEKCGGDINHCNRPILECKTWVVWLTGGWTNVDVLGKITNCVKNLKK